MPQMLLQFVHHLEEWPVGTLVRPGRQRQLRCSSPRISAFLIPRHHGSLRSPPWVPSHERSPQSPDTERGSDRTPNDAGACFRCYITNRRAGGPRLSPNRRRMTLSLAYFPSRRLRQGTRLACPPSSPGRCEFFVKPGLRSRVAWRVLVSPDYCDGSDESCRTDEHDEEGADEEVQCDSPRGRGSEYTPRLSGGQCDVRSILGEWSKYSPRSFPLAKLIRHHVRPYCRHRAQRGETMDVGRPSGKRCV